MGNVDQEPKLVGRNVVMVLSPLPEGQRERKFKLSHGDLIEEDDYDEDDTEDDTEDEDPLAEDSDVEGQEESDSDENEDDSR